MNIGLRHRILYCLMCVGLCSCGLNLTPIRAALQHQDWDAALQHTHNDPELESHLAALLIETKALHSNSPKQWVRALDTDTRAGNQAIFRLSHGDNRKAATQMAQLVRYREVTLSQNPTLTHLKSDNSDVRALAATTLSNWLPTEQLHSMIKDLNAIVRGAAVAALCRRSSDEMSAALLSERLRTDPMPHVRATAARCPLKLGRNSFSLLKEVVAIDSNEGVVNAALHGMAKLNTNDSILFLQASATGPMTQQKLMAAVELASKNFTMGKQRVKDALDDEDEEIRAAAISQLYRIPQMNTADIFRKALKDADLVALTAAKEMCKLPALRQEAVAYLEKQRQGGKNSEAAVLLLATAGHSATIIHIQKRLQKEESLAQTIQQFSAVGMLRGSFVPLLAHDNETVRLTAAVAVLGLSQEL